jgi:hypothetical protein
MAAPERNLWIVNIVETLDSGLENMATTNSADGDTKTTDSDIDISTATLAKQNHQYIDMFTFHILQNIFISLNNFSSMYY